MTDKRADTAKKAGTSRPVYRIRMVTTGLPRGRRGTGRFRLYPGADGTYYLSAMSLNALKAAGACVDIVSVIELKDSGVEPRFPPQTVVYERPTEDVCEEIVAFALSRKDRGRPHVPVYCGRMPAHVEGVFILDRPGGVRNYGWRWERRGRPRCDVSFDRLFPKLIGIMKDADTRFVVSLGGGGVLLFAHPSIFKLIEAMGTADHIDELWGSSGGSIAALAYSLGADHQLIEQEGYDLYNRRYSFELAPDKLSVLKNLILDQIVPGSALALKGFVDIQRSLQDSLERMVRRRKPRFPVYALAYNMNTRRKEILTPMPVRANVYGGLLHHCKAIEAVLASSAIPVLFVPRILKRGGAHFTYIDGSVFEEVPLLSVYHKWCMDRRHGLCKKRRLFILTVNLFPYMSTQRFFGRILIDRIPMLNIATIMLRLLDMIRRVRIDDQIRLINQDPHAVAVEVRLPKLSSFNFLDPRIIPIVISRARQTFFDQLRKIETLL